MKYFDSVEEYPRPYGEILPFGTFYEYAGTPFLDGFINHVVILSAFVIGRYKKWDEKIDCPIEYLDEDGTWVKKSDLTKKEAYDLLISKDNRHVRLDTYFSDDVLILAKMEDSDEYWIFWYDRDSSDSCIGRFKTSVLEEIVQQLFENYVREKNLEENINRLRYPNNIEEYKPIPLSYFKGWIEG